MKGVRKVEHLDPDGQLFVSLTEEVDLDDLLLRLLAEEHGEMLTQYDIDFPSTLYAPGWSTGEVDVGRYRTIPCICGEGHTFDVVPVDDEDTKRGTFLGMMAR